MDATAPDSPIPTTCLCEALRRAARMVTRMYDDALRPLNLRITQFSILAHLRGSEAMRVRDLAAGLQLEETTLTRNLRLLEQEGWVATRAGDDRREKYISITRSGQQVLTRAVPLWRAVQERLQERVSTTTWDSAFRALPKIAAGAAQD
ncbi:MarR family transcriptional regulator [Pyxidicoccus parkwayensis]|uniref:MarR family transcriptional regulator n=1 Tax=Pyxidicoccus parkwayensis TaxID=2813578 RepID=A0ABX7P150_9BACT|nr:MarR family transcriptional regulator [Pyxidicoccus parkwaysis]QSQ23506.1 MarR family transcriptional regulator [Pyxidicoccus parkwaysis]